MFIALCVRVCVRAYVSSRSSGFGSEHCLVMPQSVCECMCATICVLDESCCKARLSKVVWVRLCLLSDVEAVFQSVCVIMRPQGAENSDTLTWREEEH